jgi:molybdate transport system regulatory protein
MLRPFLDQDASDMDRPKLTVRVDLGSGRALGPGKVRLLEAIEKTGSITQAGKALGMSYRRAWLLADDVNNCFRDAVITTQPGGTNGGGAALTPFGQKLIERYRAIENDAMNATRKYLNDLEAALKDARRHPSTSLKRPLCKSSSKG